MSVRVLVIAMLLANGAAAQEVDFVSLAGESTQDCPASPAERLCRVRNVPDLALAARHADAGMHGWRDGSVMNFAYRDAGASSLRLVGGIQLPLSRVRGSDLWVVSVHVPALEQARFTYTAVAPNAMLMTATSPELSFRGPQAPPRRPRSAALHGRVDTKLVQSASLGAPRRVYVYVPPARGNDRIERVVYMSDGGTVPTYAPVIDSMIMDGALPRVMLVGAASGNGRRGGVEMRTLEYILHDDSTRAHFLAHEEFFTRELVAWAEREYGAPAEGSRRLVYGASAGGGFALHMGLRNPTLFPHVIAFSPSPPRSSTLPATAPGVSYYLWAGQLESSFVASAQHWQRRLEVRSRVTFRTANAGHDTAEWADQLPEAIMWMIEGTH